MLKENTINPSSDTKITTGEGRENYSRSENYRPQGKLKEAPAPLSTGSLIEGKVVARDRSSLFIDLGSQSTGIIYGKEFYEAKDVIKNLKIGDTICAKVVELENEDGYIELSLRDASKDINWQKLKEMKEKEEIIKVKVTGVNKGGLLTNINGMAAFLPVSQLSAENYPRVEDGDKQKILKELQKFIGKTLEVKILDLLAKENKLIVSEKAKTEQALKEILKNYKSGDVVEGKVTGIADFGVFIKFPFVAAAPQALGSLGTESSGRTSEESQVVQTLDSPQTQRAQRDVSSTEPQPQLEKDSAIEGLIHISELDWQLVQNPNEIVKVGEVVKAKIIDISNNQVFLSLKSLKENPWEEIEKKYKKDDIIKGKVISFSPFGAFVEVLPQIRGLCHVSEFSSQKATADGGVPQNAVKIMQESLKVGETYDFKILLIEPKEHRMSLKLEK